MHLYRHGGFYYTDSDDFKSIAYRIKHLNKILHDRKKCLVQSQKGLTARSVGLSCPLMKHRGSKAKLASSLSPVPKKPGMQTSEDRYSHSLEEKITTALSAELK